MMLADLLATLGTQGALKKSRVPAMKTSLGYLAKALGHSSPEECPADAALSQEGTWAKALEDHWRTLETPDRTISAYTRRNVRNDIRKVFKLASASGLLKAPLPERLLPRPAKRDVFRRAQEASTPYTATYRNQGSRRYWLPQAQWPPDIVQGFQAYRARCGLRLRETTFESYVKCLSTYLGYHAHIVGRPLTWDDAFDPAHVTAFMRWHAERLRRTSTTHGQTVAIKLATIAKVLEHRHAEALEALRRTFKAPAPLHTKRLHWVSLDILETVADACLAEGRAPFITHPSTRSPGAQRAVQFQRGVILKLLIRVPLRSRNVREMQLDRNLWKDPATGHWHLEFAGDELKIGHRGAAINKYELNLSTYRAEFIPLLEEWLTVHRRKLPGAQASPFVFLTQYGKPHIAKTLHADLSYIVSARTGQRFYPHLIRTIWATEYLEKTQDFTTVATMLGNTLNVVMRTYYDIVHKDQHAKAAAFLSTALHTG
jgi:hypothetical protein